MVIAYKDSSELSLALRSWIITWDHKENTDGGTQEECSGEALRFFRVP